RVLCRPNGRSSLVVIPPPYDQWRSILTRNYGHDLYDLDLPPDGKTLTASMIDVTGRTQLVKADVDALMHGSSKVDVLHEFENNIPSNFVFSPDGRFLYGTSYYTGVSNVFRYDLQSKKMEAISNVE